MKVPSFQVERKLWKKGYKKVAGLDEVGRGCLAGPVVAAAVVFKNPKSKIQNLGVNDSKKLSPKKREKLFKILIKNPQVEWGIGRVSEKIIDKINILEATKLAMKRAIKKMEHKPDFLILDGNFKIDSPISQKSIIKGDEKVFSVAAASILAKVWRDRIIIRYHKKYPRYGFDRHKGYSTKYHRKMLKKYGRCVIYRKSFNYGGSKTKTY